MNFKSEKIENENRKNPRSFFVNLGFPGAEEVRAKSKLAIEIISIKGK